MIRTGINKLHVQQDRGGETSERRTESVSICFMTSSCLSAGNSPSIKSLGCANRRGSSKSKVIVVPRFKSSPVCSEAVQAVTVALQKFKNQLRLLYTVFTVFTG